MIRKAIVVTSSEACVVVSAVKSNWMKLVLVADESETVVVAL